MNNAQQKSFKTTNFIFWLGLTLAIIMVGVYAYIFYTARAIGQQNANLSVEADTLSNQASEVGELKQSLATIEAKRPVLTSYFIDANDIVPFLETIEGYGRATNIETKFNTFVFKKAPDMLAVSMSASGSFTDLYHFMALLEAAPYQISMTNVDVQAKTPKGLEGAKAAPAVWEAQISLAITSITGVPKDAPKVTPAKK